MTEEDKKLVTEWLGECWHEPEHYAYENQGYYCPNCKKYLNILEAMRGNRTFTEWADFGACWERLVEKGQAEKIIHYTYKSYIGLHQKISLGENLLTDNVAVWFEWLHSRTDNGTFRFCNLIVKALKEGVL